MAGDWMIGAALSTFGSVIINLGTNILKLGHTLQSEDSLNGKESGKKSPVWIIGFVVFCLGNCLNFIAFGFAAQSLLSALGSVQFISNVFFATYFLKEEVQATTLSGTTMILCGNSLLVLYGSHDSRTYTVEELMLLYRRGPFVLYILLLAILVVALYISYQSLCHKVDMCGIHALTPLMQKYIPFAYAAISGMIGTQSVILAKSCASLIRQTLMGDNQFTHVFTYLILAAWALTMGYWMHRLNSGLQQFDAMFIVPMFQVVWTLGSIVGGGIYFNEFAHFTKFHTVMFITGVVLILCGVYHMTPVKAKDDSDANVNPLPRPKSFSQYQLSRLARSSSLGTHQKHFSSFSKVTTIEA
eukprot:GCRY01000698.1.p1 GENE.GCRY01000698.1~~GCRY01000698.1.p1  ORF type:complete len:357 (-),score=59.71 GCRY01000698.1:251-1321(-)